MDTIFLRGMEFFGHHGVLPEEQQNGQRFLVDMEMDIDLRQAGQTDDLNKTVNYAEVFDVARRVVETDKLHLVESLAERIATVVLESYSRVQCVRVCIQKPEAPILGLFESVGVKIERAHTV